MMLIEHRVPRSKTGQKSPNLLLPRPQKEVPNLIYKSFIGHAISKSINLVKNIVDEINTGTV
jgi:hypothetical protein